MSGKIIPSQTDESYLAIDITSSKGRRVWLVIDVVGVGCDESVRLYEFGEDGRPDFERPLANVDL